MNYWYMQKHEWFGHNAEQKTPNKKNTSYMIPFIGSSRRKLIQGLKKRIMIASVKEDWLERDVGELSSEMEMFYIIGCGLHKCTYLSTMYC